MYLFVYKAKIILITSTSVQYLCDKINNAKNVEWCAITVVEENCEWYALPLWTVFSWTTNWQSTSTCKSCKSRGWETQRLVGTFSSAWWNITYTCEWYKL